MGFFYELFRNSLRRRTLQRFLQNQRLSQVVLSGKGIDLGGYPDSQYHQLLKKERDVKIICSDLHSPRDDMLRIDLEGTFPVESDTQDFLLLMNVLEHLYSYQNCLAESYRILRPGGRLIGMSPFLFPVHLVPDDSNRLTESSLKRLLQGQGFSQVAVEPIGRGRWTAAASLVGQQIRLKPLAYLIYVLAIKLDKWFPKGNHEPNGIAKFPLCYYFEATK